MGSFETSVWQNTTWSTRLPHGFGWMLGIDWRSRWHDRLRRSVLTYPADAYYAYVFRRLLAFRPLLALPAELFDGPVLLACGSLGPGGTERQVVTTARGLHDFHGMRVSVCCVYLEPEVNSFYRPLLESTGVRVQTLPQPGSWDGVLGRLASEIPSELRDVVRYVRLFLDERPSVVHTWLDEVNVKAGIAALLAGVPRIVLSSRSVAPSHFRLHLPYMREGYRALLAQGDVVALNNSEAGAEDYAQWLSCAPARFEVLRNGFDVGQTQATDIEAARLRIRSHLGIAPAALVAGAVVRLSEEKQPLLLVDAMAALLHRVPGCHGVVVGEGGLRNEAEQRATAAGLEGRLHFVGRQPRTLEWMAAFDVLLLTSRKEGLPNVLIESQALGVPVVTTRAGGAPEAVRDGLTGFVVDGRADEIADAAVRAMSDAAWRQQAREHALEFVERRFGLRRMVDETLAVYRRPAEVPE